ncbi:tripartite tricarboxylate transporter substrate binding protein [Ramlibacter sp.]|uniref:tripartite tricarboxylate transporter substrate binding protein n=1 Tax=Ramlibacter sp. TaxID=1917967 RepID=UPI003D0FC125
MHASHPRHAGDRPIARRSALFRLAALGAAAASPSAFALDVGGRPIRIVVPITPGSTPDLVARHIAAGLARDLKTPFVVENKSGAGAMIGTMEVVRAKPDGLTLLLTGASLYTNRWMLKDPPYDPLRDFQHIAKVGESYYVIVVPAEMKVTSLAQLVAAAKAAPGEITYSSAGHGSTSHLGGVMFEDVAGVKLRHIPFTGAAPALTAVGGGQVQVSIQGITTVLPLLQAGKVRALAVSSPVRSKRIPDVPTFAEAGLPGYKFSSFLGILAPAGTPMPMVNELSAGILKIVRAPEYHALAATHGFEPDVAEMAAFAADGPVELERWRRLIQLGGVPQQ